MLDNNGYKYYPTITKLYVILSIYSAICCIKNAGKGFIRQSVPNFCILNSDITHTFVIKLRKYMILFTCSSDDVLLDSNSLHLSGGA